MVLHIFSMGTEILYVGLGFCILFVFLQPLHDNANDYSPNLWKSCFQAEMLLGVGRVKILTQERKGQE